LWCFRDDDKFGRRERYSGPTSDFKEKDGYKPNVKLDYIDDDGRVLNAKEAFRWALIRLTISLMLLRQKRWVSHNLVIPQTGT
jgi:SART-1 family.